MSKDLYAVLGVEADATPEELKKAYRQKAKKLHPDVSPGSEQEFKELADAYRILSKLTSRKDYDRNLAARNRFSAKFSEAATTAATAAAKVVDDLIDGDLFDRIDQFLRGKLVPKDIETTVKITLEELYDGLDKQVTFKRNEKCTPCKGRGAVTRDDFVICHTCYGFGYKKPKKLTDVLSRKPCTKCRGSGKLITNKCKACKGKGLCKKEVELIIPIPNDLNIWSQKDKLIVEGEGEHGGNLLILVALSPHPHFEVDYPNLNAEIPVQFYQAILGDLLEVDTLKGSAFFRIDPGSTDGTSVRLDGYGLQTSIGEFGDLRIKLKVVIPHRVSKDKKLLLEKYKELDRSSGKAKATKTKTAHS
jgi:molecular chaperone DnaJ